MPPSQTVCSTHKQRSVINFLVPKKCKSCEIYKKMYDVYKEACFDFKKKKVYKWVKHGFATMRLS